MASSSPLQQTEPAQLPSSLHRPYVPGPDHLDSLCWPLSSFPTSIFAWDRRRGPKTLRGIPAMVSPMLNRRCQNFPQCAGHTLQIWLRFASFAVFLSYFCFSSLASLHLGFFLNHFTDCCCCFMDYQAPQILKHCARLLLHLMEAEKLLSIFSHLSQTPTTAWTEFPSGGASLLL